MKSLTLEKYTKLEPQLPDEQLAIACKNKIYGGININDVLAQYKYCVENNHEYKQIYLDYLCDVIGDQVILLGGNNVG